MSASGTQTLVAQFAALDEETQAALYGCVDPMDRASSEEVGFVRMGVHGLRPNLRGRAVVLVDVFGLVEVLADAVRAEREAGYSSPTALDGRPLVAQFGARSPAVQSALLKFCTYLEEISGRDLTATSSVPHQLQRAGSSELAALVDEVLKGVAALAYVVLLERSSRRSKAG